MLIEEIKIRRHSQAVRHRSAKPLFLGPIPSGASKCSGLKRCRTENRRFSPVFFVFLAFPRFFKNRIFAKIKRCKTPNSTFHPEPDRWTTISERFFESFSLGKPPFFRFFQKNLCKIIVSKKGDALYRLHLQKRRLRLQILSVLFAWKMQAPVVLLL